jgi:Flp pilus assembly protein TadD
MLVGWMLVGMLALPAPARGQLQQNDYQRQQEHAARFEPAPLLAPSRQGGGAPATVRIRFYADDDYRSSGGGGRWQERVRLTLGSLNQLVEGTFGIRFEGESFRRWPRQGPGGALQPILADLEKLDPGPDVDWVVGLVSPLPLVSMSFHDLGCARVLGRHFVLRGMTSIAELQDFNRLFPALENEAREALYSRRKTHKELSIFLHEWAHTLGALHVQDPTRIMGPAYSNRTSTFSLEDAGLIAAALDARLAARGNETISWAPLRQFLGETKAADWLPAEKEALLEQLRASQPVAAARVPTVPIPGLGLPGRIPVRRPVAPETGPVADARKQMSQGSLSAASQTLAAAGSSSEASAAAAELREARRRLGLPADSKRFSLPVDAEPDYALAVQDAGRLMQAGRTREAQLAIDRSLKKYPGAPGLLVAQCELLMRQGRPRAAGKPCSDAIAVMEDLPRAHYLLGCIQAETGQPERAITSLKRAIALEPNDQQAWDALAQLYKALGRTAEYQKFAARHGM